MVGHELCTRVPNVGLSSLSNVRNRFSRILVQRSPLSVTRSDGTMSTRMDFGQPVVDADIHVTVPSVETLFPYLSDHWREYIRTSAFKGAVDTAYPPRAPTTVQPGNPQPDGTLAQIQAQVLDAWGVEVGIL